MKFYFAPMEGLTGYIYRNAHNECFNNIDKYFAPFISANQGGTLKNAERNDLLPENNLGLVLIPQLLTNNSSNFINASKEIKLLGYSEINLNLGCPSGTVVAKNKGSGFLAKPDELDLFLDEIYSEGITKISIKTRIGKEQPEEFYELIEIFNKYPVEELTIHPRIQKDFYKNKPNMRLFKDALALSKNPVCYNGDIFTDIDYKGFVSEYPEVPSIMMGRGLLANPGLANEIKTGVRLEKALLRDFHDKIYSGYKKILYGDINVLYRMKELWFYMILLFPGSEKYAKRIKKSVSLSDYDEAVSSLFRDKCILEYGGYA